MHYKMSKNDWKTIGEKAGWITKVSYRTDNRTKLSSSKQHDFDYTFEDNEVSLNGVNFHVYGTAIIKYSIDKEKEYKHSHPDTWTPGYLEVTIEDINLSQIDRLITIHTVDGEPLELDLLDANIKGTERPETHQMIKSILDNLRESMYEDPQLKAMIERDYEDRF